MITEVPPSLSHILFLFGLLNAPLDPLLYGAFTLGCKRGHQELRIDSFREVGSGRILLDMTGDSSPQTAGSTNKCDIKNKGETKREIL
jgi:hypothetical protein